MMRTGPAGAPQTKSFLILAQAFVSLNMTFLMTGIFTALPEGFAPGWVGLWLTRFAVTCPVAFLLSLIVGPMSFRLAHIVLRATRRRCPDPP